ncbi:MAG: aldehyde ferredoxin oxidoreductase family protein [Deltaproteobacteria bacterium]|nr:aldehyde ferredoxin oxidoreductase family protein [Deltaproteobacteria bacterium]
MNGWTGTILRINLTSGNIVKEPLNMELAKKYIGGRGLASKILFDEVDPAIDPLSPDNKLIFAPGPLNGTNAPSAAHFDVVTKGLLTGTIAASSSGGVFAPMLKYAGYDLLILEGTAEKPVYVWIDDDRVEIRDAKKIWGKTVEATTEALRKVTDDEASVACIGPAGERMAPVANIMNECGRAAGRTGVGAIMGSKNLKAVAVRGTGAVRVADPKAFRELVLGCRKKLAPGTGGLTKYGTDMLINVMNQVGGLPTRNFRESQFTTADKVGGESLARDLLIRPRGCFSCPISCGRATRVTNPKYAGVGEGPEYETAWSFGPDCGVDNLDAVTKANYICNEYGMDTITVGATVACAMDLFEDGIITVKDTDGLVLRFGEADAMLEAVRKAATGEGFGQKLQLGSYRLAESYGHPEYSMTVKKQETPAYDPRALQGIGLNYATSNRGGCHVRGYMTAVEIFGSPVKLDPRATDQKAQFTITLQDMTAALDSSGECLFTTFGMGAGDIAALLSAATGVPFTEEEFMKIGARIWNLERLFNLKAGLSAKDDTLAPRMLKDPIPAGPNQGQVNKLDVMMSEYYTLRGWDAKGVPTKEKLAELGL